jgi:hypothetical protein
MNLHPRLQRLLALALVAVACAFETGSDTPRPAAAAEAPADSEVSNPAPPELISPPACDLCAIADPGVPVVRLTAADTRRIGAAYSDTNVTRLAWIDSLYRAGNFGNPKKDVARQQAHIYARLFLLNSYAYMIRFATDRDTVWESDGEAMAPAFATFSDPGVVPLAKLKRARMGLGRMCADYDLSEKLRSEISIGGRRAGIRIDDVRIQGRTVRALIMDLPTSLHSMVEVWITEHVCIDVEHFVSPGPPAPYEAYILDNMRGLWVHRAGIHRPEAFVFWVTPRASLGDRVPDRPLVGARIYVPHLRLRLPIIPDIGFEDLREVDLPQPILKLEYLQQGQHPNWLATQSRRGFKKWDNIGPLPPELRRRFPDH